MDRIREVVRGTGENKVLRRRLDMAPPRASVQIKMTFFGMTALAALVIILFGLFLGWGSLIGQTDPLSAATSILLVGVLFFVCILSLSWAQMRG